VAAACESIKFGSIVAHRFDKVTEAEALRARRDMVYAQHQVGWALDRLCDWMVRAGSMTMTRSARSAATR
jgi:hypothetical protein